jgi:hypothetical protein
MSICLVHRVVPPNNEVLLVALTVVAEARYLIDKYLGPATEDPFLRPSPRG